MFNKFNQWSIVNAFNREIEIFELLICVFLFSDRIEANYTSSICKIC